jgi:hypothetical protein
MRDLETTARDGADGPATLDEARKATISKDRVGETRDFWPGFAAAAAGQKPGTDGRAGVRPAWRWALGTAGLLTLVSIGVLLPTLTRRPGKAAVPGEAASIPFRLDSVTIGDEPAQAFVYKTQDPDSTFVWVEKRGQGETP